MLHPRIAHLHPVNQFRAVINVLCAEGHISWEEARIAELILKPVKTHADWELSSRIFGDFLNQLAPSWYQTYDQYVNQNQ